MHLPTGAGQRGSAAYTEHLRVPDPSGLVVFGPAEHSNVEDVP